MKARDLDHRCSCKHAKQLHRPNDGAQCMGRCWKHEHQPADHTGACTAGRCDCDAFSAGLVRR